MGTDFFGAHFPLPKQKPISARCLMETWSVSTPQPLLSITQLGHSSAWGGKGVQHSQGCVHVASPGCSCVSCRGYHTLPLTHSSPTAATADLEQDSAKAACFAWCCLEEHWGMVWCWWEEHWGVLSSTGSTAVAGIEHPSLSPWDSSSSRMCKAKPCAFPWHWFIVTPVYRAHKFPNFPGDLSWGPWGTYARCLHYDLLCLSCCICSRFQCQLFPLGMALRNPECKVNLSSRRSWPTFFSFFLPYKRKGKKLGASPLTYIFINNHGPPIFTYNQNQMSFGTPKITTGTDTTC